ncbi:MAG TPA: RcpC/CpaB family pilus assembly protein [Streptomyces sp.]|uniref:RcpC/CpaB family pilus assembly protein n=1 Tax=Streptomyces sp. TaxID=1931 RepID=UPI002BF82C52|nr:RcpC/CpaB family pilus assembly protein [Streptomyces sp.]HWU05920.1 RcpC/CpaB family pilus assembly protein [Streptomyces sp.]
MSPSVPDTHPAPPAPCGVPSFGPLRVRGGGARRLRRALRGRRRALAAGFALASAVLAASGPGGERGATALSGGAPPGSERRAVRLVSAPVRIADAATVGLLRPGDRVDVIAAAIDGDAEARVVARDVRVAEIPRGGGGGEASSPDEEASSPGGEASFLEARGGAGVGGGALVVLSVERDTAAVLAGAGASGRLAVAVSHAE